MTHDDPRLLDLARELVQKSRQAGAEVAEARASKGWELTVRVRMGETELVKEAGSTGVALRVMKDQRVAVTSSSDLSPHGLRRLVDDAAQLLELTEPDPFAGPADASDLCSPPHPDLDLYDPETDRTDAEHAIALARVAEDAARRHDRRITLSEGATFSRVSGSSALVLSSGFEGCQRGSYSSLVVTPVTEDAGGKKRRGHYWTARRHLSELEAPEAVGKEAARRTLRQLGARKVATQEAPVIFDPDTARAILATFAGCVVGDALWRKSSYLLDREGAPVSSSLVSIIDDPLIPRAPGSRPYDGEGLRSRKNSVVESGVLKTFLLDSYGARKLGKKSTASGSRGGASVSASTSNLILQAGTIDPKALIASTERGLYVTEMMGFGFNSITGDFSRGASGYWIERGELTFPVSEVTISSNLDSMLKNIDAIANDLDLKTAIAAPTFRVSSMTIAGS